MRDLGHGGAQRQLVTLAKALATRAVFEIHVVHFYPGAFEAQLQNAGVTTFCIGKKHRWDLVGFFVRLIKVMRDLRPDVIHGYLHESNLMALFLKPLCGFPKVIWGIRDSQTGFQPVGSCLPVFRLAVPHHQLSRIKPRQSWQENGGSRMALNVVILLPPK